MKSQNVKKGYVRDVVSNLANRLATVLVGFVLLPYAVRKLGVEMYGWVAIVNSLLGFFVLLDGGVSSGVSRFSARSHEADDPTETIRQISASATFIMIGAASVGLLLVLGALPWSIRFFVVPESLVRDYSILLICAGVAMGLRLLAVPPRGLLIGNSHYFTVNCIEIASVVVRLAAVVVFFEYFHPSLGFMGLAVVCASLVQFVGHTLNARRLVVHGGGWSYRRVSRAMLSELGGFGLVNLMGTVGQMLLLQGPNFVIGKLLGPVAVTMFAPAALMAFNLQHFIGSIAAPLMPMAGRERKSGLLGIWCTRMARYAVWIALSVTVPVVVHAPDVLTHWIGPGMGSAVPIMMILLVAMALAAAEPVIYYIALGGGRIGPASASWLVSAFLALGAIAAGEVLFRWELRQIAWVLAVVWVARNVLFIPWTYCRDFEVSVVEYWKRVYLASVPVYAMATLVSAGLRSAFPPQDLYTLLAHLLLDGSVFVGLGVCFVLRTEERKLLWGGVARLRARVTA